MSVKLGMVGALVGWGGRGRRRPGAFDRSGSGRVFLRTNCRKLREKRMEAP